MNTTQKAKYQARALLIKALAHPSRLIVMDELAQGERCVCELQQAVGSDMSTVSKHLSLLRNAGLVEIEKRGTQVFYRTACPCVTNFLKCVESVLRESAKRQMECL